MPIEFVELHAAENPKLLNTEWFVLKNSTDKVFSTRNCTVEVSRKGSKKTRALGTMDPGFSMAPGESVRVITGNPGRKAQGAPPTSEVKSYHLFLGAAYLKGDGVILRLRLRSLSLASSEYEREAERGIAVAKTAS
jgi:hypothetical protein